ncbi:MAG: hypothetical protein ACI9IA_002508, partial [Enterobacterales bacterium]
LLIDNKREALLIELLDKYTRLSASGTT